jgi:hypothetical protein
VIVIIQALEVGAHGYLIKRPFNLSEINSMRLVSPNEVLAEGKWSAFYPSFEPLEPDSGY